MVTSGSAKKTTEISANKILSKLLKLSYHSPLELSIVKNETFRVYLWFSLHLRNNNSKAWGKKTKEEKANQDGALIKVFPECKSVRWWHLRWVCLHFKICWTGHEIIRLTSICWGSGQAFLPGLVIFKDSVFETTEEGQKEEQEDCVWRVISLLFDMKQTWFQKGFLVFEPWNGFARWTETSWVRKGFHMLRELRI